jgi:hypothetical protein
MKKKKRKRKKIITAQNFYKCQTLELIMWLAFYYYHMLEIYFVSHLLNYYVSHVLIVFEKHTLSNHQWRIIL